MARAWAWFRGLPAWVAGLIITALILGWTGLVLNGTIPFMGDPVPFEPSPSASASAVPSNSPQPSASPTAPGEPSWALPPPGTPWQIELDGGVPSDPGARIVTVDYEVSAASVAELHEGGAYVICYVSVGTVEDYRDDAGSFPDRVVGTTLPDWPDERYLDIRDLETLGPLWAARLDTCAAKGFDAVDPDNIDSFENDSGFPLTRDDAVAMMMWLADAAHERGLGIGQKNTPSLTPELVGILDFAVTEQCLTQGWCGDMAPYVEAGKPVLAIEYVEEGATLEALCLPAEATGLSLLVSTLDLVGDGARCPAG